MSNKPNPRRFKLAEYRERRNAEAAVEIETDDGQVFTIPAPELWPDGLKVNGTPEEQARGVLGDDEYDKFIAAGGTARVLNAIFTEAQGETPGK